MLNTLEFVEISCFLPFLFYLTGFSLVLGGILCLEGSTFNLVEGGAGGCWVTITLLEDQYHFSGTITGFGNEKHILNVEFHKS